MQKLFILVAVLCYVPSMVFSDGKLQVIADIVKMMNTSRLCDYDCKPAVNIHGRNLTVAFQTTVADGVDTNVLCKCMSDYMREAVGDATSDCSVTNKQLLIEFHGEYNANVEKDPPLTTLSRIVSNYEKPDLGGYDCTRKVSEQNGRIFITLTYNGNDYKSACDGILRYLNQNHFLDGASHQCNEIDSDKKTVLELWANN